MSANHTFHAAVVDYLLPDGNGVDLAAIIQEIHPKAQIVIVTGGELRAEDEIACDGRRFQILRKPFLIEDLIAVIASRRLARKSAAGGELSSGMSGL